MFQLTPTVNEKFVAGTAFVNQTAAVVYEQPNAESKTLQRLDKGSPVVLLRECETGSGWWVVRTMATTEGYIKANTKTISAEGVSRERKHLRVGFVVGWIKIGIGSAILLAVGALWFYASHNPSNPHVESYGETHTEFAPTPQGIAMVFSVTFGNILWGLEQLFSTRRALRNFDLLWKDALPTGGRFT